MARTKARVAAAHAERQRAPGEALVRKRAAIAKAARVMSVQEVEIATLEREVIGRTRATTYCCAVLALVLRGGNGLAATPRAAGVGAYSARSPSAKPAL